jgi:mRNA-degrading endonuclease RelE of RelBE toxin-antitoxin system
MRYEIVFAASFKNSIKQLKKRFPSVKKDVGLAIETLLENLELGSVIPGGSGVRKLRLKNSNLKRGKSGGYRMLYLLDPRKDGLTSVCLLLLYAKSDQENISTHELQKLLEKLND